MAFTLEQRKAYYKKHPELRARYQRRWYRRHPGSRNWPKARAAIKESLWQKHLQRVEGVQPKSGGKHFGFDSWAKPT